MITNEPPIYAKTAVIYNYLFTINDQKLLRICLDHPK